MHRDNTTVSPTCEMDINGLNCLEAKLQKGKKIRIVILYKNHIEV